MKSEIADLFYEAAVLPEFWPKACEALTAEVGGTTATIFAIDHLGQHRYVCTPNIQEKVAAFVLDPRIKDNVRPARALEKEPFTFMRELDIIPEAELEQDFIFIDHVKPAGMRWSVGCAFQEPSGHVVMFDLLRRDGMEHFSDGDIARLNEMKPDLARAVFLASRLGFSHARTMADSLGALGLAAAVLSDGGQVLAANEAFEKLAPRVRIGANDRIHVDHSVARIVNDAVQHLQTGIAAPVQSVPLGATADSPPLVLHILPVRRAARDIFARSLAIVIVTPVGTVGTPETRVLSGLFDLTPSEAKVARLLVAGLPVEGIAQSLAIAPDTVRTHLKRVMAKTGTQRQVDLVRILLGAATHFPS